MNGLGGLSKRIGYHKIANFSKYSPKKPFCCHAETIEPFHLLSFLALHKDLPYEEREIRQELFEPRTRLLADRFIAI
jgi:hypothetical protein